MKKGNDLSKTPGSLDPQVLLELENVRKKCGRRLLGDDDLAILACEEIARTTTREEKNYAL